MGNNSLDMRGGISERWEVLGSIECRVSRLFYFFSWDIVISIEFTIGIWVLRDAY